MKCLIVSCGFYKSFSVCIFVITAMFNLLNVKTSFTHILKGAFNTSTQVNIDLVQLIVFYLYKQKYKTTFGCEKPHSNKIITHSPNTSLSFNPHLWPLSFGWPSPVFFFYLYVLILSLTETTFIFSQLTKKTHQDCLSKK